MENWYKRDEDDKSVFTSRFFEDLTVAYHLDDEIFPLLPNWRKHFKKSLPLVKKGKTKTCEKTRNATRDKKIISKKKLNIAKMTSLSDQHWQDVWLCVCSRCRHRGCCWCFATKLNTKWKINKPHRYSDEMWSQIEERIAPSHSSTRPNIAQSDDLTLIW